MGSGILYNKVFLYIIPARARIRAVGIREMGHGASLPQARRANKKTDTDSKNEFTSGPTLWFDFWEEKEEEEGVVVVEV